MRVLYSPNIRRQLKKIRDAGLQNKYRAVLEAVICAPQSGSLKTGDLTGIYTAGFSYRGTQYRIAYCFSEQEGSLLFLLTGTRENFYSELKRYLNSAPTDADDGSRAQNSEAAAEVAEEAGE